MFSALVCLSLTLRFGQSRQKATQILFVKLHVHIKSSACQQIHSVMYFSWVKLVVQITDCVSVVVLTDTNAAPGTLRDESALVSQQAAHSHNLKPLNYRRSCSPWIIETFHKNPLRAMNVFWLWARIKMQRRSKKLTWRQKKVCGVWKESLTVFNLSLIWLL